MRNYDVYGRLAAMEIFSHGESEARSDLSTNPRESTRTGIRENPCPSVANTSPRFYTHDGNKNVSEAVAADAATNEAVEVVAHYDYAAFGAVVAQKGDYAETNPWRFSSEYEDTELGLVYYNYRHYEPVTGRWLSRDPIGEMKGGLYCLNVINETEGFSDVLGLAPWNDLLESKLALLMKMKSAIDAAGNCMKSVGNALNRRNSGWNDKLNHCMSSCEIADDCGQQIATALGFIKEVRDLFSRHVEWGVSWLMPELEEYMREHLQGGGFQDSVEDFMANAEGFDCRNSGVGCECCCRMKYGK